jgi:hypothetical protein
MMMRLDLHWVKLAGLKEVSDSLLAPGFTGSIWTRNGQLDPYGFAWPFSETHSTSFGCARAFKVLDAQRSCFKNDSANLARLGAVRQVVGTRQS